MTSVLCICRKAFEFVYRMEPADDEDSKRPLFQSWVGKLRELPENAKISSVRFPEVGSTTLLPHLQQSRCCSSGQRG